MMQPHPQEKIQENTKKVPTTKTTQNALKYKAKTLYYYNDQNTRPKRRKKSILIFTKKSGPNLGPWAQKSILRFMRTLGPSLVAIIQSSWILLSNTLGGKVASTNKKLRYLSHFNIKINFMRINLFI